MSVETNPFAVSLMRAITRRDAPSEAVDSEPMSCPRR